MAPEVPTVRGDALRIAAAALGAVDPAEAVRTHVRLEGQHLWLGEERYALGDLGRIVAVGAGKGSAPMAAALAGILGDRLSGGAVAVKYGHTGARAWRPRFGRGGEPEPPGKPLDMGPIVLREAGHPVPDAAGAAAAAAALGLLGGLGPRDLVVALWSGGGSALLPAPAPGLRLEDVQAVTRLLLASGADITEVNAVRKHCSRLAGGQLARLASPARVVSLLLSDVVGSPLDVIASGPTAPDPTTFADALAVLERRGVAADAPPAVVAHLRRGAAGQLPETPKPGDALFARVRHVLVGDNARAGRAACEEARRLGWNALHLGARLQGEAREVGLALAGLAAGLAAGEGSVRLPACLVLGGETTVTLSGDGKGGRNQELALAAALALYRDPSPGAPAAVVTLATDGNDGPTDAAGALADRGTVLQGRARGLDAPAALRAHASYDYWSALGDLLLTGPTSTNVNDLALVFVGHAPRNGGGAD